MIYYLLQSLGWIAAVSLMRQNCLLMTRMNWLQLERDALKLENEYLRRDVRTARHQAELFQWAALDDEWRPFQAELNSPCRTGRPGRPGEDARGSS